MLEFGQVAMAAHSTRLSRYVRTHNGLMFHVYYSSRKKYVGSQITMKL